MAADRCKANTGQPNLGKSTLLNMLHGTSRTIASGIAGTTRDAVDEVVEFEGSQLQFVDTAGIRRKSNTRLMAETLSVVITGLYIEAAHDNVVLRLKMARPICIFIYAL